MKKLIVTFVLMLGTTFALAGNTLEHEAYSFSEECREQGDEVYDRMRARGHNRSDSADAADAAEEACNIAEANRLTPEIE